MGGQKRAAPRHSEEQPSGGESSDPSEGGGRRHKKAKLMAVPSSASLARPESLEERISTGKPKAAGNDQEKGGSRDGSREKGKREGKGKGKGKHVGEAAEAHQGRSHSTSTAPVVSTSNAAPVKPTAAPNTTIALAPPVPIKRPVHAGTLRRLAAARPPPNRSVRLGSTLSGAKIGGPSKDMTDGKDEEDIWVKQKNGLGLGGYLKKGMGAFTDRGCRCLSVHGMGAAIPLALSLGLAIRDALPGGSSDTQTSTVQMEVTTGSAKVFDEITPENEEDDLIYQNRIKSTVSVQLSIRDVMAGAGPRIDLKGRVRGAGPNVRGRKRRGGPRS
ncbi:BQ2448_1381 [Microbotryum intermedium]|uniref:BQ2448_1381 protein n=1 Tax=Microbotryum intermedium TaxID=269621 RepID=A0A238F9Y7_9BASI|nr:BQ2448_1381 [Microbotryum intermedium]